MTRVDASSVYHNLKLNRNSSYLITFACQFGRYKFNKLSFGVALAGICSSKKTEEILNDMPYVFGIADDILRFWCAAERGDHNKT